MPIWRQSYESGADMRGFGGSLAAFCLLLCVALAPVAQALTHPPAAALAHSGEGAHKAAHSHAEPAAHDHSHLAAHSHGAAHQLDHDHIPALILSQAKQPALWPQGQPKLTYCQSDEQAAAEALRRPPRTV